MFALNLMKKKILNTNKKYHGRAMLCRVFSFAVFYD